MKAKYRRETFKSRAEWLKARGFGGSSASAIIGSNPWMSKLELYNAIVNPKSAKEKKQSESMQYGVRCEPLIREEFRLDHPEWKVRDPKDFAMYRRTDKPYLTATLDGEIREMDGKKVARKGILEIKTHDMRGKKDAEQWEEGRIPQNYFIQVLHYLMVMTDFDFAVLVGKLRHFDMVGGKWTLTRTETVYRWIFRDEVKDQIEFLERAETEFYEENIRKRIPPIQSIGF